ncbi:hypothetical protein TVAG_434400 [Trichomonas vaginalis G3]|uniref:Uncharacterized protein n=1 Tax=Trichomonas vaginalis (strain ATCC PRA-98 / G3) TaxID=412133 RepID=A2DSM3_TRIV3|nr:hypothetical protein TVAGG3_0376460 [Trichomonas vaginalis G3]EAY16603.1 hypothetical protein TVAG_434400 [Trichomonas vaginalis G3]KAI5532980.1 hypothetical protein TVAGG3_0376460 [Trichomonas vaginalis G3]|eukprot:XP_001328826.1 hypothetical protein [Trichomonas vaginalis G3]
MSSPEAFIEQLDDREKALYSELRDKAIAKYSVSDPNIKLGQLNEEVKKQFTLLKWILDVDEKKLQFGNNDLEKMNLTFGPDLTSLPRYRLKVAGPFKNVTHTPVKHNHTQNRYNRFVKEQSALEEFKDMAPTERMKVFGKKWNELTEEEKSKYA